MDWANERYVRLYVRDTVTWKMLCWQARALMPLILRKLDRSGVVDIGGFGESAVATITEVPIEFVREGLPDLLKHGVLIMTDSRLTMPNYIPAQETRQSDAQRQRNSRERRASGGDNPSPDVTSRHQVSPDVTPSLAVPSRTDPPVVPQGGQIGLLEATKRHESVATKVRDVIAHYQKHHPRSCKNLDSNDTEWRKIKARLEDGWSVDDLCKAIDGYHRHQWHTENGQTALALIMRDDGHVTSGIEWFDSPGHKSSSTEPPRTPIAD